MGWPQVDIDLFELRLERPDGTLLRSWSVKDLGAYPLVTEEVTQKCDTMGTSNTAKWVGVRLRDLVGEEVAAASVVHDWDPMVTFVGMDGFDFSVFGSRVVDDDVMLERASETSGSLLPPRLEVRCGW